MNAVDPLRCDDSVIELPWLDLLPVGMCVLDNDLRVYAWNETLERWTGLARRDMLLSDLGLRFPRLRLPQYLLRLRTVLDCGTPAVFSAALHRHLLDNILCDRLDFSTTLTSN